ncbi:NAD(P)-dependent oxidoreductase [Chitinophaga caeni]|uniref:NAD(P)-dependent oxidoreductase n=1 Tax=Chitinophaga caeni TaxID=2029983 RepID=A0A291QQA5_9BACT|nr:glucose 1-dehydrogenase [Chitinophaga caeni]ATL46178.1 NAD(P)-dependent oxidoreductase [Chitinophaga caeni]
MKTMLITGGSRGIGAAVAKLAAAESYEVVVNYLNRKDAAEAVVKEIQDGGGTAIAIQGDMSNEKDIQRVFQATVETFGGLDSLVNNAGILMQQSKLEDISIERMQKIFSVNITGPMICAREAVKLMAYKNGGHGGTIINISSLAAKTGAPFEYIDYAASKAAIDALTLGLAKEVASEGIRVNGVRPAFIETGIHASGGDPGRIDRLKETIPLKRGGTATEVAQAVLWLASDKSAYSTGIFIDVAGGK